jgi:hypothetical protein
LRPRAASFESDENTPFSAVGSALPETKGDFAMTLGYDKSLYILPFDHRGSFQTKMFGWTSPLRAEQ